jgi:putative FmdB family regulatory protein
VRAFWKTRPLYQTSLLFHLLAIYYIIMPTYEYKCKSCGSSFEIFQNMKDEPLKVCPECGREIRRVINGGSGVIFKGSGFYSTDKAKTQTKGASANAPKPADKNETVKKQTPSDDKKKQKHEEKKTG